MLLTETSTNKNVLSHSKPEAENSLLNNETLGMLFTTHFEIDIVGCISATLKSEMITKL